MRSTLERELKLRPGAGFTPVEFPGSKLADRALTSTYYDTDDLRLAAGGVTLRRRVQEGEAPVWQLKLPRSGDRMELEWEAPDERVPEEAARLVTVHARGRVLSAVATLRTDRSGVLVHEQCRDLAEVVYDEVKVVQGEEVVRSFTEVEVELVDGDRRALRRIEKALRKAGAEDGDGRPKLHQALDLEPPGRDAVADTPAARLQATLRSQYEEVLLHDPGTRLGEDPEELHDHRVAVRRLRAMLRAGRPLLDRQWADGLRGGLRQAGRALAEVRDLDVMLADVTRLSTQLPEPEQAGARDIVERLQVRRDSAHARLADDLCQAWYVSLLNRLEQAVDAPRFAGNGSLTKTTRKEHRRVRKLVRKLPKQPSDSQLHQVRVAVKRARYAAELADATGAANTKRYAKKAKKVQDVLGAHQDAVVATSTLAEIDVDLRRPAAHIAVTALQAAYQERQAAARRAFPKAWRQLDTSAAI